MTDLTRLKSIDVANVYKDGTPAAELRRFADRVEFSYLEGYQGRPVATTLPLSDQPVLTHPGALPPYFTGLLPEGRRLAALRSLVKTSADDEFSLLLAVGSDPIGDVQVLAEGEGPPSSVSEWALPDWAQLSFDELFAESLSSEPDRVGIPGVQDKISGAMITIAGVPSAGPVVIKLDPPEFPHLVENEAFFLSVAKELKLQVESFEMVSDRDGRKGLVISRFDRRLEGGVLHTCAQEDGCQVLGRYPADRYSIGVEEVFDGLAAVTGAPLVAKLQLFRYLVHGYLIGNGDQHARNLAVLRCGDEWKVSPLYDTPSSYPYGDTTIALPMLGETGLSDVPRRKWLALASAVGLPEPAAELVLDDLVAKAPLWLSRLSELPFTERVVTKFESFVRYRLRLVDA